MAKRKRSDGNGAQGAEGKIVRLSANDLVCETPPRVNWSAKRFEETITEYVECMERGDEFPPLLAFHDGESYWLADGYIRLEAYCEAMRNGFPVEVRAGGKREAQLHACKANTDHGTKRTNADKQNAVRILLEDEEWSRWSDREIARWCAVTQPMVSAKRQELEERRAILKNLSDRPSTTEQAEPGSAGTATADEEPKRLVRRGGTVYPMHTANIGARKRQGGGEVSPRDKRTDKERKLDEKMSRKFGIPLDPETGELLAIDGRSIRYHRPPPQPGESQDAFQVRASILAYDGKLDHLYMKAWDPNRMDLMLAEERRTSWADKQVKELADAMRDHGPFLITPDRSAGCAPAELRWSDLGDYVREMRNPCSPERKRILERTARSRLVRSALWGLHHASRRWSPEHAAEHIEVFTTLDIDRYIEAACAWLARFRAAWWRRRHEHHEVEVPEEILAALGLEKHEYQKEWEAQDKKNGNKKRKT